MNRLLKTTSLKFHLTHSHPLQTRRDLSLRQLLLIPRPLIHPSLDLKRVRPNLQIRNLPLGRRKNKAARTNPALAFWAPQSTRPSYLRVILGIIDRPGPFAVTRHIDEGRVALADDLLRLKRVLLKGS
jgi:hypothetical protein